MRHVTAQHKTTEIVRFQNVGLRYETGPEVLSNINLSLEKGSFHFLTGSSGAGKSSLLKLLYLGASPSRGTAHIFGRDVMSISRQERPYFRQKIGVVFQDFNLIEHLTALDNVALPLKVTGQSAAKARKHAAEILAWVGLDDHIYALPSTLSGGQRQRVSIARAVITQPDLLLADEPTGNVDDQLAMKLLYLFEELNKMGTTVILATHNRYVSSEFDHPILHLEKGRLILPGSDKKKVNQHV
jgi:cell division transport system ATP-binding protein